MKFKLLLYYVTLALLIGHPHVGFAADIIKGDNKEEPTPNQTFSFPILKHISSPSGDNFYVVSHPSIGNPKEFALAAINRIGTFFTPFGTNSVSLNNVKEQPNPFFDAHVQFLGLLSGVEGKAVTGQQRGEYPAVVLSGQPTTIYVLDTFFGFSPLTILSVTDIKDAHGAPSSGIVGLGNMSSFYAMAAVKGNRANNFGDPGSGIALCLLERRIEKKEDKEVSQRVFLQVNARAGNAQEQNASRALSLDRNSNVLKINNVLSSIENSVNFTYDENLMKGYGALKVKAGAHSTDGARAIFVITPYENHTFALHEIVPITVFDSQHNKIIGDIGAQAPVSLHSVKTMLTSTNLHYLIVQGGNGLPESSRRNIYALPLVYDTTKPEIHGTIADKLEIPAPNSGFKSPATAATHMTTSDDEGAKVGGGELISGDIVDMFVKGDSVFVSVFESAQHQKPGIFYSQALFDSAGKIKVWTSWQRAAGTIDPVFGFSIDSFGNFITMTGQSIDEIKTVKRTAWANGDKDGLLGGASDKAEQGLIHIVQSKFPQQKAGVQNLFDFSPFTPGFNGISLLLVTGINEIIMAETGNMEHGSFLPHFGDFSTDSESFKDGAITKNLPTPGTQPKVVAIAGGVLDKLGPIAAATIARDGDAGMNARLFVGGIHGLAVLVKPNGDGWDACAGLGPHFRGLTQDMSFKKIGNYAFIRSIIGDDKFLYVLTDKKLDRIDLTATNFESGEISFVTLATHKSVPGLNERSSFFDFLVSDKLGLLATNKGLYRVGNGKDIKQAIDENELSWTQIPLPEGNGPVMQLLAVTKNGRAQEVAKNIGGNLYVLLNAYTGKSQGKVCRFAIKDVSDKDIDDTTVMPMPDFFIRNVQAPFFVFNGFRNRITTDGAAFFQVRNINLDRETSVVINFGLRSGSRENTSQKLPISINNNAQINQILRSYASGCWLIGGDFGLRVSE
jgi:hypothetical protein